MTNATKDAIEGLVTETLYLDFLIENHHRKERIPEWQSVKEILNEAIDKIKEKHGKD